MRPVEASLNEMRPSERKGRRNRVVKKLYGLKQEACTEDKSTDNAAARNESQI